ncbi:MAG: hypothetical protein KC636_07500 [Myxococcales bacterium]|nr:hypothetical protein [Myxococcales bacterium]
MTSLLALLVLLVGVADDASPATTVLSVTGGDPAPGAWFAVAAGAPWICWHGPRSYEVARDCWRPIPAPATGVDLLDGLTDVSVAFLDRATLVLADPTGVLWTIERGEPEPRLADEDEAARARPALERPTALRCGPDGWLPRRRDGRWVWIRDRCPRPPARRCLSRASSVRVRRPTGVGLRVALGVAREQVSALGDAADWRIAVAVIFAFDPARLLRDRRARALLQTPRELRPLPALVSRDRGLRRRERAAVERILCAEVVR